MERKRILLVCAQRLLGESLEGLLRAAEDLWLIGPWEAQDCTQERLREARPAVVVIAEEDNQAECASQLTAAIMQQYPNLPVIRVGLNENIVRVISAHMFPARGADLLESIRRLPEVESNTRSPGARQ